MYLTIKIYTYPRALQLPRPCGYDYQTKFVLPFLSAFVVEVKRRLAYYENWLFLNEYD